MNGSGHTVIGDGFISNLSLTNNGAITASTGNLILDVSSTGGLTNNNSVNVLDGSTLTIQNLSSGNTTITNTGTIKLNASANPTSLVLNDGGAGTTFTLTGTGGVLNMTNNANNLITSGTGGESLVNDTGHTIQGSGTISNFTALTNNGSLIERQGRPHYRSDQRFHLNPQSRHVYQQRRGDGKERFNAHDFVERRHVDR